MNLALNPKLQLEVWTFRLPMLLVLGRIQPSGPVWGLGLFQIASAAFCGLFGPYSIHPSCAQDPTTSSSVADIPQSPYLKIPIMSRKTLIPNVRKDLVRRVCGTC